MRDSRFWKFIDKEHQVHFDSLLPGDFVWVCDTWNTAGAYVLGLVLTPLTYSKHNIEVDIWLFYGQKICTFGGGDTKAHLISRCDPP
jgi:hypothetical protein